jgi:cytoskeletal protein RodZ
MKRCPQCLFIYPETDSLCDFDNTPLVVVDEAELESATSSGQLPAITAAKKKRAPAAKKRSPGSKKSSRKKTTAVVAVAGLAFALSGFFTYYSWNSRAADVAEIPPVANASLAPVVAPPLASLSSSAVITPEPSPAPTPASTATSERTATSHSRTTTAPVSTSGPGMGKAGGKPVIVLTTGGKIDADEVWRTRDGVWYRRAGIVTLLKHNRVKAIVTQ